MKLNNIKFNHFDKKFNINIFKIRVIFLNNFKIKIYIAPPWPIS